MNSRQNTLKRYKSRSKQWREQCKRDKKCIRCGLENDRWPKVLCTICATKSSFRNEEWRTRNKLSHSRRIAVLEKRMEDLKDLELKIIQFQLKWFLKFGDEE